MSRETGTIAESLETLKKRTNEKGVGVALADLVRLVKGSSPPVKSVDDKAAVEISDTAVKLLVEGVGASNSFEKLKVSANVANAVRLLCVAPSVTKFPKALGPSFFSIYAEEVNDIDGKCAFLEFYIRARTLGKGSFEVLSWLKTSGADQLLLGFFQRLQRMNDINAKIKPDALEKLCMTSATALELVGGDMTLDSIRSFETLNMMSLGIFLLQISSSNPTDLRLAKQKVCSALANIIVLWRKNTSVEVLQKDEEGLAELVVERIKSDSDRLKPSTDQLSKADFPIGELKFLRNWCFNSRRLARLFVSRNVHVFATNFLALFQEGRVKNNEVALSSLGLLRNLARKQVKVHQDILSSKLLVALIEILKGSINQQDASLVAACLGCMVNLTSSVAGREALTTIPKVIVANVDPAKRDHVTCELALGVMWGVGGRSTIALNVFVKFVAQVLQQHSTQAGCVRRALGALCMIIEETPESKTNMTNLLNDIDFQAIKTKHLSNPAVLNDLEILSKLIGTE